jgi:indolepyruvate ferredoxin oxidoreductase beta subunit
MSSDVTNVVIAGLGGQGVLKASDILSELVFRAGLDVKKSEVHGMAQRGGSVASDVRFGPRVFSPMAPRGEAQFLVVLEADQFEPNKHVLAPNGRAIMPDAIDPAALANRKSINVALLGVLSRYLPFEPAAWHAVIRDAFIAKHHEANLSAFELGRSSTI